MSHVAVRLVSLLALSTNFTGVHILLFQAKMISNCKSVRNEMITAGAVKTFFELIRDQSNELTQTLCTTMIHTILKETEAIRKASKCRAAEIILQVLGQNADNEFWEQRLVVLSISSRLLLNRSCGLVFVYGGLMSVIRHAQADYVSEHDCAGTQCLNFILRQLEW